MASKKTVNVNINRNTMHAVRLLLATNEGKVALQRELLTRFAWLGKDVEVSGADTVDALNEWFAELQRPAESR